MTPQLVKAVGQIEDSPQFAKCSVVVTNVAPTITECRDEPLRAVFSKFGRVLQLHLTEGTTTVGDGEPLKLVPVSLPRPSGPSVIN